MKILLIGKFPPLQGGISAKSYWLTKELRKRGFTFKIVTIWDNDYSIRSIKSSSIDNSDLIVINDKEIPWHIPETKLLDDRLIYAALKAAIDFKPDLIETNYLWPFGKVALFLSHILQKPLLMRHAGSDIMKFYKDREFFEIMRFYFNGASAIATNAASKNLIEKMCDNHGKVFCLQRYVPAPETFRPLKLNKEFDILFAGKINYHWNLKGLKLLMEVIKQKRLSSLFVVGGKYKNELLNLISISKPGNNIKVLVLRPRSFATSSGSSSFHAA